MDADSVLASIEESAGAKGLPIIGPWRGAILDDVVKKRRPSTILEVGTLVGYSAIRMARLLGPTGRITCVEVDPEMAAVARDNLEKAGLEAKVTILVGDAKRLIPELEGTFDMVFLDAEKREYLAYLLSCERLIHPGSVVVADNVKSFSGAMSDYLDYVRNSGKYASEYREGRDAFDDSIDAVEISIRN